MGNELDVYSTFATLREAMVEHARAVGAIPWNSWLQQARITARHFQDDPPPRGRNLERARI
eukprot:10510055-Alexandrium_andersonii.AAC.1